MFLIMIDYKKKLNRIAKKIFNLKSVSLLRRLHYKNVSDNVKEVMQEVSDISKGQNHGIKTANRFYI